MQKATLTSFDAWRQYRRRNAVRGKDAMHDYQKTGMDFIRRTPFCALFIDLGLGKTITSLTAALEFIMDGEINKVLVVAPLKVANRTWPDEFATWEHTCCLNYRVLTGSEAERKAALRDPASVHIINREQVEWLVDQWRTKWPYDMVIIDESSSFKDHTSKRFKALKKVRRYIKRMVQLTATPAAETYLHLFAQIYLLDEGERFGRHITKFRETYATQNKWSQKWTLRPGAAEDIVQKVSDICLVMKAEDYLDMEEPLHIETPVILSKEQMARYEAMSEDMLIDVVGEDGEVVTIEAETAASLMSKLLQMSSGVIYNTRDVLVEDMPRKVRDVYHLHDEKLDAMDALLEQLDGENVMVVYHFKSSLDRLKKRYPQAVEMDKDGKAVTPWNKGKIPMLLVHPQSAGHGLNLQKGGRAMIFFDIPWSLETYLQVIGRLHRQGQTKQVLLYHLISKGTADELVVQRLREKRDTQEWLFTRLKQIARKRRRSREALDEVL